MIEKHAYQNDIRNKNMAVVKSTLAAIRSIHGQDYIFTAASLSKLTGNTRQTLSLPVYRILWDINYASDCINGEVELNMNCWKMKIN